MHKLPNLIQFALSAASCASVPDSVSDSPNRASPNRAGDDSPDDDSPNRANDASSSGSCMSWSTCRIDQNCFYYPRGGGVGTWLLLAQSLEGPLSAVSKPIFASKLKDHFAACSKIYKIHTRLHRSKLKICSCSYRFANSR